MNLNPLILVRRNAYRKTFNGPEGRKVLADLRRFCKATVPTANLDNERATYLAEGRREVWLRLMAHLQLTEDDIYNLVEEVKINE